VTYNPDIDRLRECIDAVLPQVDKVLVFDNASANIEQVLQIVGDYQEGVILRMNGVNAGVAAALSEIM
jgi:rhamnosyltransferase